ncbi:MAG: hypothetical protein ACSHWW_14040 [Nonlabens sp.]|uniref:hypothetical protein n=1 Tax=Nonlabens sp. TaxID=1888209 RepID=UPI003EF645FD
MENYNRASTIKKYFNEITSGKLEFSELRQKLENLGIEQEEITVVIRQVDKKVQRNIEMKAINATGKNLFYGGLIVALFGLVLTIGTLTGLVNLKGIGIIAYGPIAGGLITAMTGKSQMSRS